MGADPERTSADQADALAALIAPQVTEMAPEGKPAAPAAPAAEPDEQPVAVQPPTRTGAPPGPATRPAVGGGKPPGPRGDGELFQPVPGGNLVDGWRPAGEGAPRAGDGIDVVAPEGTPVHAVAGGTVAAVEAAGRTLRLHGDDQRRYVYALLRQGSVTVAVGQRIEAGRILGAVGAASPLPHLHLEVDDPGGSPLNPYELLLGVPDPNELGYGPGGQGVDIDPHPTDGAPADLAGVPAAAAPPAPSADPVPVGPGPTGTPATQPPEPAAEEAPAGLSPDEVDRLVAGLVANDAPGADPDQGRPR